MKFHWFISILLAIGLAPSYAASDETTVPISGKDREEILAAVKDIRSAILHKDSKLLLKHVSRTDGLSCTDTNYSYREVATFLADKNSYMYLSLYDNRRYAKQCGRGYPPEYPAISETEFLKTANDTVTLSQVSNDWVEVVIKSPIKSHYPREWYFHREAMTWKISGGSFIVGDCTCG